MTSIKTSLRILSVATVTAATLAGATGNSLAQRGQSEWVNRPAQADTTCKLDDGYGRYRHCSAGGE